MSHEDKGILESVKDTLSEYAEATKEKLSEYTEAAKERIFGHEEGQGSGGKILGLPVEKTVEENLDEEQEQAQDGRVILDLSGRQRKDGRVDE